MSIWKKAVSTLATAGLLASLLGTAVAGTASAASYSTLACSYQIPSTTCSQVANGYSFVKVTISAGTSGFTSGNGFVVTSDSQPFSVTSGDLGAGWTISSDAKTLRLAAGSAWSNVTATVFAPTTAGTTNITSALVTYNLGTATVTNLDSLAITWVGAGGLAVSEANSKFGIFAGPTNIYTGNFGACPVDLTSGTKVASAPAKPTGNRAGTACLFLADGYGNPIVGATITSTIAPVGMLFGGNPPNANWGQTQTWHDAGAGYYALDIITSGIAGASTPSVTVGSTSFASHPFVFYGDVASIVASVGTLVGGYSNGAAVAKPEVDFIAKDAAGNLVPTVGATASFGGTSVFASATSGDITQYDGTATGNGAVNPRCAANGADTVTVSQAVGSTTIKSNAVKVYCSDYAKTFGFSFDAPTVLPGGQVGLTLSGKDASGNPAYFGTKPVAVVSSGVFLNATSSLNADGTATWKFLAPFNTGVVTAATTVTPLGGSATTIYASVTVGTPAPAAVATNGSALGKTLTGPFTTATKVAAKGAYVTFKMSFGSADAGKTITVYKAAKVGTSFPSPVVWVKLTTRVANANGDVFVYVTSGGAWLSIRGTDGVAWTPGVQAVWR